MFGKILEVNEDLVKIENIKSDSAINILNFHVVFEEEKRKIVGEIVGLTETVISILLVGEIIDNKFISGVLKKPNFKTQPRIIYKSEVELLIGKQDVSLDDTLYIGKSYIYDQYKVTTNTNDFLANHFAIVGNTGSGKSCGVARIIQNIFNFDNNVPKNAHLILFDVYGEYNSAFETFSKDPEINYKSYTTALKFEKDNTVRVPAYFLEVDDLALLLNATDSYQIPILEKTLNLVLIFASEDPKVMEYKNSIIAASLLDILSSGKTPVQVRDQIVAILSHYNTDKLNLNSIISQPGYNRTLKQCLNIDSQGKMNAMGFVVDYLETYEKIDLGALKLDSNIVYTLSDLYYALEFALISEGVLNSHPAYDRLNVLKVRLKALIESSYSKYFEYPDFISKDDYVKAIFTKGDKRAQIVNMDFNFIDERFAKVLTKVFSKLFFNFVTRLDKRASYPIHIILEEAHRYVNNDKDNEVIGYNIFDRITKEGRKYGVILGFITQRPSELSKTALSQCSNFIVYRMYHPEDIKIIADVTANVSKENIEKIKTLSSGTAMVFGTAFKLPLITKLDLPDPMPQSSSVDIVNKWYNE
ncbi:MAG TPA: DUF87 domain-containing protein [Bacilli bacterium]|nr:DUF87 domain-containing protein [Bacilli bacterium]